MAWQAVIAQLRRDAATRPGPPLVLAWHGLRGADPDPAGRMLITLVRIVLRRRPARDHR